jgi:hypothetical protein
MDIPLLLPLIVALCLLATLGLILCGKRQAVAAMYTAEELLVLGLYDYARVALENYVFRNCRIGERLASTTPVQARCFHILGWQDPCTLMTPEQTYQAWLATRKESDHEACPK